MALLKDGTVNIKAANMGLKTFPMSHGLKTYITCVLRRKGLCLPIVKQQTKYRRHPGQVLHVLTPGGIYSFQAGQWRGILKKTGHRTTCKLSNVDARRTQTHLCLELLLRCTNRTSSTCGSSLVRKKLINELPPMSLAGTWSGIGLRPDSMQTGNFKLEKVQS